MNDIVVVVLVKTDLEVQKGVADEGRQSKIFGNARSNLASLSKAIVKDATDHGIYPHALTNERLVFGGYYNTSKL